MLAPALAFFALLAQAQTPAFEPLLLRGREGVFEALAARRSAKSQAAAGRIEEAARGAQALDGEAVQLLWNAQDIRRRAGWIDPSRGRDWFFDADVQRLRFDLGGLAGRAKQLEAAVARLAREAGPDPALAAPVARLLGAARGLRVAAGRLANDARWVRQELLRPGYDIEGAEIAASGAATLMSAFHIEDAAKRLARKVSP